MSRVPARRDDGARYGSAGPAVVALRFNGASFTEIAQACGLASAGKAHQMFLDELARADIPTDDKDLMRAEAAAQIRSLLTSVWGKAHDPSDPEHLVAVDKARGLIDRHVKLFGLDAPTEVVVHTPTTAEIDTWVRQVVGEAVDVGVVEAEVVEADIVDDEGAA